MISAIYLTVYFLRTHAACSDLELALGALYSMIL